MATKRKAIEQEVTASQPKWNAKDVLEHVENIEVNAVMLGVPLLIRFVATANPADIGDMLRALDPDVEFRAGGNAAMDLREKRVATVRGITARHPKAWHFFELGVDGRTVNTMPGQPEQIVDALDKMAIFSESRLDLVRSGLKADAMIFLLPEEMFDIEYYENAEGKAYFIRVLRPANA